MNTGKLRALIMAGVSGGALLYGSASFAQAAAAASAGANTPSTNPNGAINSGEVIVTAQKRSEKVLDVPISITALSANQLETAGVTGTQALDNEVPGLHMDRVGYTSLPSIRGVTTFPTTAGVENNVALYIDNIYEPGTAASTMDLPDVSYIDVLKGPQGTLFGRNATGGAIQIFTKDPKLNAPGGGIEVGYGAFNDAVVKGFITGPIVPGVLAASLSGYYEHADNYYRSLTPSVPLSDIEKYSFRGKLLYEPTDSTRVLITGYYARLSDPSTQQYEPLDGITVLKAIPGSIYPTKPWEVASNTEIPLTTSGEGLNIQLHQKTSVGDLTVLGGWSESRVTRAGGGTTGGAYPAPYTGGTPYYGPPNVIADSYQAEVDFASRKFGPFSFVGGANYYNSFNAWDPLGGQTDIPGAFYTVVFFGGTRTSSYAVFGEGTYQITDDLSLIAGVRYNDDNRSLVGMFFFDEYPNGNKLPTWETRNWGSVTQRVSLRYKVTPTTNAYFTYSTGFQSGNFDNTTIPIDTTPTQCAARNAVAAGSCALPAMVQPETITAFELGVKTEPTPWLHVDAAIFDYTLTNMQISQFKNVCLAGPCPPNPTEPLGSLSNAAATQMYGAELDVDALVTPELRIHGGLSLLDAYFSSYPGASWEVPAPGGLGLMATPAQSAAGKEVPRAPKATLTLSATYTKDLPLGTFTFTANGYASERVYLDVGDVFYQPAYVTLGLRATFSPASQPNLVFAAWGTNITNVPVILGAYINADAPQVSYLPPATYGVTVSYKF